MTTGVVIPVEIPGGWAEIVGERQDLDTRHWRRCSSFAIHGVLGRGGVRDIRPWLTVDQMLAVCADGRYEMARRCDRSLRHPNDILGPSPAPSGPYGRIVTALTAREAAVLCRLVGGELADEIQARILCRHYSLAMAVPAWTRSPWSDWSDHLIAYGQPPGMTTAGWFAAEDRCLPIDDPSGLRRVAIKAGSPVERLPGWDGEPDAGRLEELRFAAAWLVMNE